jgi:L-aspartate oxidase
MYAWEVTNLHTIAVALVAAARLRAESRGCHRRSDVPGPLEAWRRRILSTVADGRVSIWLGEPVTDPVADPVPMAATVAEATR